MLAGHSHITGEAVSRMLPRLGNYANGRDAPLLEVLGGLDTPGIAASSGAYPNHRRVEPADPVLLLGPYVL